jgi:putative hemolysin
MHPSSGRQPSARVFSIQAQPDDRLLRTLFTLIQPGLESLLGLSRLNEMYEMYAADLDRGGRPFCDIALEALQITPHAWPDPIERVPTTGPLVIVANHPLGGVDGLVLHALLSRVRPDVRLLGNFMLAQIPDLRGSIIFVDPFEGPGRAKRNIAGVREAIRWVKGGGALVVFPAGEVSPTRRSERISEDSRWPDSVTRLITACGAPVLPAFIEGANSPLFYGLGLLHPRLRTAMLPREVLRRQRTQVKVHFGSLIPQKQIERLPIAEATAYLRLRTYALCARTGATPAQTEQPAAHARPAIAPRRRQHVASEMARLIAHADLVEHERFSLVATTAREAPGVLDEIGRARATTFCAAGQGAGEAIDRDAFDDHYIHLVLWDRERELVAGAYRLGPTDQILPARGVRGLYTSTLFRLDARFFDRLGPALELGRSFVLPEYQKDFAPLMLLWKGIGRIVAEEGRYLHLFGAVSISRQYSDMTRALVSNYLGASRALSGQRPVAVPRNPPRFTPEHRVGVRDLARLSVANLDELIREMENGERGLPVLLRHYLSLNARVLGMNVDRSFGDVLDALMLLDLRDVPAAMLARFVGHEAAARIGRNPLRQSA